MWHESTESVLHADGNQNAKAHRLRTLENFKDYCNDLEPNIARAAEFVYRSLKYDRKSRFGYMRLAMDLRNIGKVSERLSNPGVCAVVVEHIPPMTELIRRASLLGDGAIKIYYLLSCIGISPTSIYTTVKIKDFDMATGILLDYKLPRLVADVVRTHVKSLLSAGRDEDTYLFYSLTSSTQPLSKGRYASHEYVRRKIRKASARHGFDLSSDMMNGMRPTLRPEARKILFPDTNRIRDYVNKRLDSTR